MICLHGFAPKMQTNMKYLRVLNSALRWPVQGDPIAFVEARPAVALGITCSIRSTAAIATPTNCEFEIQNIGEHS